MAATISDYPLHEIDIRYSDHSRLNTYQVCFPRPLPKKENENDLVKEQVWVVFIHGGAWYDPSQDATCFNKAQSLLLDQSNAKSPLDKVMAFASINYRLSPPPTDNGEAPADPSDVARQAFHPDHIGDVLDALAHLQTRYPSARRYVLAGHSCGATLAMQVAMSRTWAAGGDQGKREISPPLAIIGLAGIYDLPALVKWHAAQPFYAEFVQRAFGNDAEAWRQVSPSSQGVEWEKAWPGERLMVLAHSREDELVEWEQVELMLTAMREKGFSEHATAQRRVALLEIAGRHRQIWEQGTEAARAIEWTLAQLDQAM